MPDEFSRGSAARLALRIALGTVGLVVAAATAAAVGLMPLPEHRVAPLGVTVDPVPADQVRTCAGSLLRLGDDTGQNAGAAAAVGTPAVTADAGDAALQVDALAESEAGTGGSPAAPRVVRLASGEGDQVAAAQSQRPPAADLGEPGSGSGSGELTGFAASACGEPSSSSWLVGGATTVGRTTILTIVNPTEVPATVALELFGEQGRITAPGMNGIEVAPGSQRVIPLAGFAVDEAIPVVHVTARGGRVVAYLQQSIVRGLDSGGVDVIGAAAAPDTTTVIPGVRIRDAVGVSRALGLEDWRDAAPALRLAAPGDDAVVAQVSVVPLAADGRGGSFQVPVPGGAALEVPLDSGIEAAGVALADGLYTVTVESDAPLVAAVRITTAVDRGESAAPELGGPASDVAWFASAPALGDTALVPVADGPGATLVIANPTSEERRVELTTGDGRVSSLVVPARGAAAVPVSAGSRLLSGVAGLHVSVGYADEAELAGYTVSPPRPVAGPIIVRPVR